MAGGKLSPRQKMINMMYLVLTALLALNISKDILDAFSKLNADLENSARTVENKNQDVYAQFQAAALENPGRAQEWADKAEVVRKEAEEVVEFINNIKNDLIELHGGLDEDGKPQTLDNKEKSANYLFNPVKVGGKDAGKDLREKIADFRESMMKYAGDNQQLIDALNQELNTEPRVINKDGTKAQWESAEFEHLPFGAVLTFLTSYQSKVRVLESDVISELLRNIDKGTLKFTGVVPVKIPRSTYVTQGDSFHADVFLAAYDENQKPEIELFEVNEKGELIGDGRKLSEDFIKDGMGKVSIPATQPGTKRWGGIIRLGSGSSMVEEKFWGEYNVAPPSVVISPTAMNVLYRGVDNPIEISVPGVDPNNIVVSGIPGLKQLGSGQYTADVTRLQGTKVNIKVDVKEDNGKTRTAGSKEFRIKGLPPASGMVYNKTTGIYSKNAIKNATIDAKYEDFAFDLSLKVIQFDIVIPGFPPQTIRGNRLDDGTKRRLDQLRPGSSITIRNIRAQGPKGMNVTNISNISVDVN